MATYTSAGKDVHAMLRRLVDANYPALKEGEVTFEILMAAAPRDEHGEPKGPALKTHNWPSLATVRVNPLKARVAGRADVEICLDGDQWDDHTEPRQIAILDHELRHLNVRQDAFGGVIRDDAGRPKIKLFPHDFQMGAFWDILKRHGEAAYEHEALTKLHALTQHLFDWAGAA